MIRTGKLTGKKFSYIDADLAGLAGAFELPVTHNQNHHWLVPRLAQQPSWYGGIESVEAAKALIVNGWREGAVRMDAVRRAITSCDLLPPESVKRRLRWSDANGELDVDRILGNADEPFRTTRRDRDTGPAVVQIVGAWGGHAGQGADALFYCGAAMTVLCDMLEQAGYAVDLSMLLLTSFTQRMGGLRVRIKDAGAPLMREHVAAITAHAGVFRTYGFRLYASAPVTIPESGGHPDPPADHRPMLEESGLIEPTDILLPHCYSEAAAVAAINDAITKLNQNGGAA